uniref:Uncharacterized protein n=1 Tax=Manihot esculenta TaxID=3983 RepID=A0A2C9U379_MANES
MQWMLIEKKNVESISIIWTSINILCDFTWLIYGIANAIGVSNLLGQMIFHCIYRRKMQENNLIQEPSIEINMAKEKNAGEERNSLNTGRVSSQLIDRYLFRGIGESGILSEIELTNPN